MTERYPAGLTLPHQTSTRGWKLNDWTDDTDLTVLVMRTLRAFYSGKTRNPAADYAERLTKWYNGGFTELGDTGGEGCGNMTWRVLRREDFTRDPFHAAKAIIGPKAGNGAIMRTAPCAFTRDPAGWASYMCQTTHSDTRCVAACVAQTILVRGLAETPKNARVDSGILRQAMTASAAYLSPPHQKEMMDWALRSAKLSSLELDARGARGYTFKTFGCAVWAFRQLYNAPTRDAAFFETAMRNLVMEAGDADTNAAVAGAVLGAAVGYKELPEAWIQALPHRVWLLAEIDLWYSATPC
jgi:ADP-ribosylglycohydrolase